MEKKETASDIVAELFLPRGGINVLALAMRAKRIQEKKGENTRRDRDAIEVSMREVKELPSE
jgi:hypothetical protein